MQSRFDSSKVSGFKGEGLKQERMMLNLNGTGGAVWLNSGRVGSYGRKTVPKYLTQQNGGR